VNDPQTILLVIPTPRKAILATGANEVDYHVKHSTGFASAGQAGRPKKSPSPTSATPCPRSIAAERRRKSSSHPRHRDRPRLQARHDVRRALDAKYLDDKGASHPMIMGCYGIGIGRILIGAIESMHDDAA